MLEEPVIGSKQVPLQITEGNLHVHVLLRIGSRECSSHLRLLYTRYYRIIVTENLNIFTSFSE